MSHAVYYGLIASIMFVLALYGILAHRHILRKILAVNIMSSSVFLFLVALSYDSYDSYGKSGPGPDPVCQAMVITGLVVAVSATALALTLFLTMYQHTSSSTLEPNKKGTHSVDIR